MKKFSATKEYRKKFPHPFLDGNFYVTIVLKKFFYYIKYDFLYNMTDFVFSFRHITQKNIFGRLKNFNRQISVFEKKYYYYGEKYCIIYSD